MKIGDAIQALRLVPADAGAAITAAEFIKRWQGGPRKDVSERTLQRWVADLSAMNFIREVYPPTTPRRYHRSGHHVSALGMSPEMALRLALSARLMPRDIVGGGGAGGRAEIEAAEAVLNTSDVLRELRRRVAVLPDGLGRLPAETRPGVGAAVAQAVGTRRVLRVRYAARDRPRRGGARSHDLSVQGVVSKDGTSYLVACKGLDDPFFVYAVHRIEAAEVLPARAVDRSDFDLEAYIAATHRMSFTAGDGRTVALELRVAPESLWHFSERRLCENQRIRPQPGADGRHTVTATLPMSEMLVPFLLSLGESVEVTGPPELRAEVARRAQAAARHYAGPSQGDLVPPQAGDRQAQGG